MRIGIFTKQIGNCLDNIVLAKQVPQFMKTLSKRTVKKESHFSQSNPRRKIKFYSQSHKLGKKGNIKFHTHMLVKHMSLEQ